MQNMHSHTYTRNLPPSRDQSGVVICVVVVGIGVVQSDTLAAWRLTKELLSQIMVCPICLVFSSLVALVLGAYCLILSSTIWGKSAASSVPWKMKMTLMEDVSLLQIKKYVLDEY